MEKLLPGKYYLNVLHFIFLFFLLFFSEKSFGQQGGITSIYTDYQGFWNSSSAAINPIKPENDHNVIGFSWNGATYSTGVNNAALTAHGVNFSPVVFQAFPVRDIALTGSSRIILGQLKDGVDNGASTPAPFTSPPKISNFLTDGVQGLNIGTGVIDVPASTPLTFDFGAIIDVNKINDGIPDLLISQVGFTVAGTPPDNIYFVDANGNRVGNIVSIDQSQVPFVGNWTADLYDLNGTLPANYTKTDRQLRVWAADVSAFGINASNYSTVTALKYELKGYSDPAFLAFNTSIIQILSANDDAASTNMATAVAINVLDNDVPSTAIDASSVTVTTPPQHGSYSISSTGVITYTPTAGFYGTDNFVYRVSNNGNNQSDIAQVTVTVGGPVAAPVFDPGLIASRCAGTGSSAYTATATNSTGITYALSPAAAGSIDASSGLVTWSAAFSGTATITATASGQGGPQSSTYTVTVNPIPDAPTANNATICSGSNTTLTATAPGGTYNWYDSVSGGTPLFTGASFTTTNLTSTTTYYVQTTVNGCTSARTAVTVTVNPIPDAPTASGTTVCKGNTATLTATAPGGIYNWYDVASGGIPLSTNASFTTPFLSSTTTYYVETTVNGCTSSRTAVTVTVNPIPAAPTASNATICSGSNTTLTAIAPGGTYEWYAAASGGTSLANNASFTTPNLTSTTTYYVRTTVNGCISPRTAVTVTVNPIPVAPTASDATICSGNTATLTATGSTGTYEWFDVASGGTLLSTNASFTTPFLSSTTTYYVETTVNGCTSPRTAVTVTVNPIPAAPIASDLTICSGNTATLTANGSTGSYEWYAAASGGTSLFTGASFTTPNLTSTTAYYVQTTVNGCTSTRTPVSVTVNPIPSVTSGASAIICNNIPQSYTITSDVNGAIFSWGRAAVTGISNAAVTGQTSSTINEALINTTSDPIAVAYSIVPQANGCSGQTFIYTVTVNPMPSVTSLASAAVCSNFAQNYTITSNVSGSTFSWSRTAVTGISNTAVSGQTSNTITETLNNATTSPILVTYVIVPQANGCAGNSFNYQVTVNPTPTVTSAASGISCSGSAQSYNITSNVSGATFSWSRAVVPGISNPAVDNQSASSITEALVNTTSAPIAVAYGIVPSANGCTGASFTYTVTVNPTSAITSAGSNVICNNEAQNYIITSNVSGSTFSWSRAAVTGISNPAADNQTSNSITETLANTTSAPIAVAYTIVPQANGCTGISFTYTITVNPTPMVTSAANATICNSSAQNYAIQSNVNGTAFSWGRAAVAGISNTAVSGQTSNTITETLVNTTAAPIAVAYGIIPSANGCTGTSFTYTITVNPTPTITSAASAGICNQTAQNYAITSDVSGAGFSWGRAAAAGISNAAVTNQNSGTITETLVNTTSSPVAVAYSIRPEANGCAGPAFTYTVTVNPTPTITSSANSTSCNQTAQNYTIISDVSGTTYTWGRAATAGISNAAVSSQSSNNIMEALDNTTSSPIAVVYTIIPQANGCTGTAFNYTVTVNPTPAVTSAASGVTCNQTAQNYTITSNVSGATYSWGRAAVTGIGNAAVSGQSSNSITETLDNTTSAPIAVTYTIVPEANGCTGPAFDYVATVNPTSTITSAASTVICNQTAQNYTISSNVTGATFSWGRAAVTGISNAAASSRTSNTITETLNNTTSSPIVVSYVITPEANGCSGTIFQYQVTVNPTPKVTSAASATICNQTAQDYTISSDVNGATFSWGRAATTGISNASVSGQSGNAITEVLANTTSAPVAVTYSIIPEANGCTGTAFNYIVTVNPTPTITSLASATICNRTAQDYTISSDVTGATFSRGRAATTGISNAAVSSQSSNTITESLINTTSSPIAVAYTITPQANGCTGTTFTYTVTVNPTPVLSNTSLTQVVCSGENSAPVTLSSNVVGANFTWAATATSGTTGYVASGTETIPAQTLFNSGTSAGTVTYTVKPFYNDCQGETSTYTITVNPVPVITSAASATICNRTAQDYTIGSNVSGTTYSWDRAATTGISNAAVAGQSSNTITEALVNTTSAPVAVAYSIRPEANGCTGNVFTYTVTVNPTPSITSSANAAICNRTAQDYTISSDVNGATFSWGRAATAGISNAAVAGQTSNAITEALVNTTSAPIAVAYSVTPQANGCTGVAFTYTVTVNPTPAVTSAASAVTCNNEVQDYTIISDVSGATFSWGRAAVAGISNTAVSSQSSSTITETLTNTTSAPIAVVYSIIPQANGCTGANFTYTVTVNPTPAVTSAASATVCNNEVQNYTIISNVSGATYTWGRAAVPGISNAAVTGQATSVIAESLINSTSAPIAVTYTIVPAANGCTGTAFSYTVTVNPTPVISNASFNQVICSEGSSVPVTLTSTVTGSNFTWTATATSGTSGYAASGTETIPAQALVNSGTTAGTVTYTVKPFYNGCEGVNRTYTITVNPKPATPVVSSNSPVCNGTSLMLTTPAVAGAIYTWTGPNGFTSNLQNPEIANASAAAQGTYSLTITADGCTSNAGTTTVTVNSTPPTPVAGSNGPICAGETLNLTASNIPGATYSWTGSNGFTSSVQNPVIDNARVAASGTYAVKATVNGCTSAAGTVTVVVNPIPPAPSVSSNSPVCAGSSLNLTATSTAGASYSWTGPKGFTSALQNPVIPSAAPENSGIYSVIASANGCSSPASSITVLVNQAPPKPVLSSNSPVCSGSLIQLTCTAYPGAAYQWTGPNSFTSDQQNPVINNPVIASRGRYTVVITTPGCTVVNTAFTDVKVNQTPVAPVATSSRPLCDGQTLKLSATTVDGAIYAWFGPNGFTSNLQNPEINKIAVKHAGKYFLTVTVNGCTSAATSTTVVVDQPAIVIVGNNKTVCANNPVAAISGSISGGSTTGNWNTSGSGTFTAGKTSLKGTYLPSAADIASGTVTLTLTANNANSCVVAASSFKLTIAPAPVVFAGNDQEVCSDGQVILKGKITNSDGGVWSSSGTGKFNPSNTSLNARYIPGEKDKTEGIVTLTLTSTGNGNCTIVSDQMKILIVPTPKVNAGQDIYVMQDEHIVLQPAVIGTDLKYSWTPNLYLNDHTLKNPVLTGTEDITYTLTVTGSAGCMVQDQVFVKVLKPITIPNTFTPNNDGINDNWTIKELYNYPDITVKIFNRYGMQLFYSQGYGTPWDGTYKGQPLPIGTYYYIIDLKTYGKLRSGPVTIIR